MKGKIKKRWRGFYNSHLSEVKLSEPNLGPQKWSAAFKIMIQWIYIYQLIIARFTTLKVIYFRTTAWLKSWLCLTLLVNPYVTTTQKSNPSEVR